MSRINSNVMSLIAQRNLQRSNNDLQIHLQRLSTGLAITRGADDPSGLIVSERLRSEIAGVRQAIDTLNARPTLSRPRIRLWRKSRPCLIR